MPCLVLILALFIPRVTLVLVWLTSNYLGRAYQTAIWPLLGFFFVPLTTLVYAWAINSNGSVSGGYALAMIVAVLIDLGVIGGGGKAHRTRRRESACGVANQSIQNP